MSDKINPDHYRFPNGIQVIDLIKYLPCCEANVVKYVARAGRKDGEACIDDLLKAKRYLDILIADHTPIPGPEDISDPAGIRNWGKY